jgi:DNA-binding NtrC family response regulator
VWPTLPKPRFWCDSGRLRPNPAMYGEGTLILQNIEELETSDQQRVLEWCSGTKTRSRVIATASRQLVALVENGRFSRRLYDCLKSAQLLLM